VASRLRRLSGSDDFQLIHASALEGYVDKRYQVFVSSTYTDLQEERAEVMQALLELKCIPAGMELFPAANDTQWEWIKRVIDESDYYIVIVAGRYGTRHPDTGIGYTEMEYRYALEQGKPVIGFFHKDPGKIASEKCESDASAKESLEKFRKLVQSKLCRGYSNAQELGAVLSRSVTQLRESSPAIGWVRANFLDERPDAETVLKLRQQIDSLTEQLKSYRSIAESDELALAHGDDLAKCGLVRRVRTNGEPFSNEEKQLYESLPQQLEVETTWDRLFASLVFDAPLSVNEYEVEKRLSYGLVAAARESRRIPMSLPSSFTYSLSKSPEHGILSFNDIMIQFRALGLVEEELKKSGMGSQLRVFKLTNKGERLSLIAAAKKRNATT
jgi:hypothetical protein